MSMVRDAAGRCPIEPTSQSDPATETVFDAPTLRKDSYEAQTAPTAWTAAWPVADAEWHVSAELVRRFLGSLAPATASAYGRDIKDFGVFCQRIDITPLTATRSDIELYRQTLE